MPSSRQRGALPKLTFPTLLFATSAALCVVTGVLVANRRPADDGRGGKPKVRATPGPWGEEPPPAAPSPASSVARPAPTDAASASGAPGMAVATAVPTPSAPTPIPRRAVKGFGDEDEPAVAVAVPTRPGVTAPPMALPPGMAPPGMTQPGMTQPGAAGMASAGAFGQPPAAPPTVPYDPLAPVTPSAGPGAMTPSDYSSPFLVPTPYVAPPIPPSGLNPAQMAKRATDAMFAGAANGTARGSRAAWPGLGQAPGTPKPPKPYFTPVTNGSYDASATPTPMTRGGTLLPPGSGFDSGGGSATAGGYGGPGGANPFPFPSDATRGIGKPSFRLPPADAPPMGGPGNSAGTGGAPAPGLLDGALGPDFGAPPGGPPGGPSLDPLGADPLPIDGPPPDSPPPTPRADGRRGRGDRSRAPGTPSAMQSSSATPAPPPPPPLKITRPGAAAEFDRALASVPAPGDTGPATVSSALEKLKAAEEADTRRRAAAASAADPSAAGPDSAAPGAGAAAKPADAAPESTPISYSAPGGDSGAAGAGRPAPSPETAARVGGRELPRDDARRRGEALGPLLAKTRKPAPVAPEPAAAATTATGRGKPARPAAAKTLTPSEAAARMAADDWAERAALADEARRQSLTVTDDDLKAHRARLRATHGGRYEDALREAGVTGDELTAELRDGALADKLLEAQVARRYDAAALKDEYEAAPARYDAGRRVKVLEILKRGPAGADTAPGRKLEKTAKDLAKRAAEADADGFAEIARETSDAPTRDQGGDRGWLDAAAVAALPEETRTAIARLKPGDTSPPVELPGGFAVYRLAEVDEAQSGYDKAKPRLMDAVKAREAARLTEAALRKGDVYLAHRPPPATAAAAAQGDATAAAKVVARKAALPAGKSVAGDAPEGFESAGPPVSSAAAAKPASAKAVASPGPGDGRPARKPGSGSPGPGTGTGSAASARADAPRRGPKASALPLETTEATPTPADNRSGVRKALASLFGPSPSSAAAASGSDPLATPAGPGPGSGTAAPGRTPSPDRIAPAPAPAPGASGSATAPDTAKPPGGSGASDSEPTVGRVTVRGGRAAPGSAIRPGALSPAEQAAIRASRGGLPGDGPPPADGRAAAFGPATVAGASGPGGERPLPESGATRGPSTGGLPVNASLGKGPVSQADMMGLLTAGGSGGGGSVRPVSARGAVARRERPAPTAAAAATPMPGRPEPVPGFDDPAAKPAAGKPGFLTGFFGRPTPASGP